MMPLDTRAGGNRRISRERERSSRTIYVDKTRARRIIHGEKSKKRIRTRKEEFNGTHLVRNSATMASMPGAIKPGAISTGNEVGLGPEKGSGAVDGPGTSKSILKTASESSSSSVGNRRKTSLKHSV
jgi:hypothetical protein